uniref:Uncharacterized protein n=1 Tax=Arundo donax TaxID=35708 RepID=A0A0A9EX91_ARUDO
MRLKRTKRMTLMTSTLTKMTLSCYRNTEFEDHHSNCQFQRVICLVVPQLPHAISIDDRHGNWKTLHSSASSYPGRRRPLEGCWKLGLAGFKFSTTLCSIGTMMVQLNVQQGLLHV